MKQTLALLRQADALRNAAAKLMVLDYPLGKEVHWPHGKQTRYGRVIDHHRYLPRLKVRTPRQKEIWINVESIQ